RQASLAAARRQALLEGAPRQGGPGGGGDALRRMRIARSTEPPTLLESPPPWPPLLASRGPGAKSRRHAHHAMHGLLSAVGGLRRRAGRSVAGPAAGVLTGPDVAHEIDARGADVLLAFIDPESDAGQLLRAALPGPVRLVSAADRDALLDGVRPDE